MKEHATMLKIGEFARIGRVSIVTLRHYDQCGLLKPSMLDESTSYRYYSLDQLPRLYRILALKDLGFPLDQIASFLEENLSLEQLKGMFELKQAYIQQAIDAEQIRLKRIAARLHQIEQEEAMPKYDVLLKNTNPLLVASIRKRIPIVNDSIALYQTLSAYLEQHNVQHSQPDLLLYYSRHELHDDGMSIDVEVAIPLTTSLPGNELIRLQTLPASLMACTVHTGNLLFLGQAFIALHRWIEDNGYRIVGPVRQVHLQRSLHMNPTDQVTEIQFPVEKHSV